MRDEPPAAGVLAIDLLPMTGVDDATAGALLVRLSRRLALPCRLLPRWEPSDLQPVAGRDQLDADRLLQRLEQDQGDDATLRLGVTAHDLGSPLFTFFFGLARHGGRAALVSLARLRPEFYGLPADDDRTLHRAVLEALHELGHVLGLPHCRDARCVMRFSTSVEAIDVRGQRFCDECASRLPEGVLSGASRGTG
ncbi:MAG: hypothetical protein H6825_16005 [Planctomycetes bacterium]|nr:hypothetical protein [Planctomycetota bacterium]